MRLGKYIFFGPAKAIVYLSIGSLVTLGFCLTERKPSVRTHQLPVFESLTLEQKIDTCKYGYRTLPYQERAEVANYLIKDIFEERCDTLNERVNDIRKYLYVRVSQKQDADFLDRYNNCKQIKALFGGKNENAKKDRLCDYGQQRDRRSYFLP